MKQKRVAILFLSLVLMFSLIGNVAAQECIFDTDCSGGFFCYGEGVCKNINSFREADLLSKNEIHIGDQKVKTKIEFDSENEYEEGLSNYITTLSNDRKAEIKIMPNLAYQTALEKLTSENYSISNYTVELKEVGSGNETRLIYKIQAKTPAKLFGFVKTKVKVSTNIDAETGEVLDVQKSWWSFFTFLSEDESEGIIEGQNENVLPSEEEFPPMYEEPPISEPYVEPVEEPMLLEEYPPMYEEPPIEPIIEPVFEEPMLPEEYPPMPEEGAI